MKGPVKGTERFRPKTNGTVKERNGYGQKTTTVHGYYGIALHCLKTWVQPEPKKSIYVLITKGVCVPIKKMSLSLRARSTIVLVKI